MDKKYYVGKKEIENIILILNKLILQENILRIDDTTSIELIPLKNKLELLSFVNDDEDIITIPLVYHLPKDLSLITSDWFDELECDKAKKDYIDDNWETYEDLQKLERIIKKCNIKRYANRMMQDAQNKIEIAKSEQEKKNAEEQKRIAQERIIDLMKIFHF